MVKKSWNLEFVEARNLTNKQIAIRDSRKLKCLLNFFTFELFNPLVTEKERKREEEKSVGRRKLDEPGDIAVFLPGFVSTGQIREHPPSVVRAAERFKDRFESRIRSGYNPPPLAECVSKSAKTRLH